MDINHDPLIKNTSQVFETFGIEKEAKYVCTSALNDSSLAWDIYYTKEKNPEHGNHYFGIRINSLHGLYSFAIRNADTVTELEFSTVVHNDKLYYSQHRHDCVFIGDSMIDGGRAYTRCSGESGDYFKIIHGVTQTYK